MSLAVDEPIGQVADLPLQKFLDCLAEVESQGNAQAWGDDGHAMGTWQVHTEFVQDYIVAQGFGMLAGRWDDVARRAVVWFITKQAARKLTPAGIAMRFHLGVHAVESKKEQDGLYASRFSAAWSTYGDNDG